MEGSTFFVVVIAPSRGEIKHMATSGRSETGTVREFLDWVKGIREENEQNQLFDRTKFFYRGQSDIHWPIIPSVFRTDKGTYCEYDLYSQAQSFAWDVLHDSRSPLEILVRLQHFGLPTRLLDITHNPLVALFFACNENPKRNGCVYWGTNDYLSGNEFVNNIAKVITEPHNSIFSCCDIRKLFPETFANIKAWSKPDITRLELWIKGLSQPYYFLPPYNNSRIKAQKGAFIIPPLICTNGTTVLDKNTQFVESPRDLDYRKKVFTIENTTKTIFQSQTYLIRSKHKESLLSELREIGISRASLFPDDIKSLMIQIADSVKSRIIDFDLE